MQRATRRAALISALFWLPAAACGHEASSSGSVPDEGLGAGGVPNYSTLELSRADADVLRRAYGIEDPHRLYVSDSSIDGILKYDTQFKRCGECLVNSYRVGYVSVRRPDESWEAVEHRVLITPRKQFTGLGNVESTSTSTLDPEVRPIVDAMLHDARAAGFHLRVAATYRSPLREAYVMSEGRGRTHTLTSSHSYGRAVDVVIDDGRLAHKRTRSDWVAFREWVTHYQTGTSEPFRVLGRANDTWDWAHVELPSSQIGFTSIDDALSRGRACLAAGSNVSCNFLPHLP